MKLFAAAITALALVGAAQADSGERQQARTIANRLEQLYASPAGLCKLQTIGGGRCTKKLTNELELIYRDSLDQLRALSVKSIQQTAPHRYRVYLGKLRGTAINLDLRKRARWEILDEDTHEWFVVPPKFLR